MKWITPKHVHCILPVSVNLNSPLANHLIFILFLYFIYQIHVCYMYKGKIS